MKGDKRKGLLSGYKKAGPTLRFTIIVAALSLILSGIYFLVQLSTSATKEGQDQAQVDRDIKHKEQLESIDQVKSIIIRDSLNAIQPDVRERPYVFFKMTKLLKPLAVGEKPTVEFILANSGQMEAIGFIRDISYFFDVDPVEQSFEYQNNEPVSFSLAPTAEWNGQLRLSFVLTKEKIKVIADGGARLFFFARGEYKDSLGRVYALPFCRMYDKGMLGNLIMCPDQMAIRQKEENGDR